MKWKNNDFVVAGPVPPAPPSSARIPCALDGGPPSGHPLISKSLFFQVVIILALSVLIIWPRLTDLGRFLTADEKRWQANVAGFTTKLSQGDLAHLVQQPHPGITTQWLAAPTVFSSSWAVRKLPLAAAQAILVAIIGYVLWRLFGKWPAIAGTAALALDPLLIAHTRIYAMDSLLALACVLSLAFLFLWRSSQENRYLAAAGFCAAAAYLSKLPGIMLLPFTLFILFFWAWPSLKQFFRQTSIYLAGFAAGSIIILPSWLFNPLSVIGDFTEFFRSDDYTALHQAGNWYYADTLWFLATPLQLLTLLAAAALLIYLWRTRQHKNLRDSIFILLSFAVLFTLMMTLGAKKGDRYILPVFTILDFLVAGIVAASNKKSTGTARGGIEKYFLNRRNLLKTTAGGTAGGPSPRSTKAWRLRPQGWEVSAVTGPVILLIIILLSWQAADIYRLTPYALAYINPIAKPFLGNRHLGWGEGLDIAADYLNAKPNAASLKVAAYYPVEFSYRFKGEAVAVHQWEYDSINYVVLYRGMYGRGPNAWETDVLQHFRNQTPEKIIRLNGIDYVWIYKR